MEHIVQFGVSFDDDKIKERIEANLEKIMKDSIEKYIKQAITGYEDGRCDRSTFNYSMRDQVNAGLAEFFEKYKDMIIKMTTEKLVEKLFRTKAIKEALANSIKENVE